MKQLSWLLLLVMSSICYAGQSSTVGYKKPGPVPIEGSSSFGLPADIYDRLLWRLSHAQTVKIPGSEIRVYRKNSQLFLVANNQPLIRL